jgi:predicted transcriptional regulator of viral defense system
MKVDLRAIKKTLPPVFEADEVLALLSDLSDPHNFLMRATNKKELIRLRRGLYADPENIDYLLIANRLLSPSYVSFETALSYYGMIPERVLTTMSVTTQKARQYETPVGLFEFFSQKIELYAAAYTMLEKAYYYIRIATPEKALFDTISRMNIVARSLKRHEPLQLLTEDLRIEEADLRNLSKKEMKRLAPIYNSGTVKRVAQSILELK